VENIFSVTNTTNTKHRATVYLSRYVTPTPL